MLWYKKILKGELVMLEKVIYKEEILTGHLYTNRDALRNSNYQMPDQSPVEARFSKAVAVKFTKKGSTIYIKICC